MQPLRDLYRESQDKQLSSEIIKHVSDNYKCSETQVKELEAETHGQSVMSNLV